MTHDLAPEIQHLLVGEWARLTQRAVVEPGVAADDSVRRSRLRRGSEPLVERAALVRLHVLKVIHLNRLTSMTWATASDTDGNSERWPV
jgi:hypothetical protein